MFLRDSESTEACVFDGYCEVLCDKVLYNVKKKLLLIGFGSCTSRVTLTGLSSELPLAVVERSNAAQREPQRAATVSRAIYTVEDGLIYTALNKVYAAVKRKRTSR